LLLNSLRIKDLEILEQTLKNNHHREVIFCLSKCSTNFSTECFCDQTTMALCSNNINYCKAFSDASGICLSKCDNSARTNCICGSASQAVCSNTQVCENASATPGNCFNPCINNFDANYVCDTSTYSFCSASTYMWEYN